MPRHFEDTFIGREHRKSNYRQWSERAVIVGYNSETDSYDIIVSTAKSTGANKKDLNSTMRQVKSIIPADVGVFSPGDTVLIGYANEKREHPVIMGGGDSSAQTPSLVTLGTSLPAPEFTPFLPGLTLACPLDDFQREDLADGETSGTVRDLPEHPWVEVEVTRKDLDGFAILWSGSLEKHFLRVDGETAPTPFSQAFGFMYWDPASGTRWIKNHGIRWSTSGLGVGGTGLGGLGIKAGAGFGVRMSGSANNFTGYVFSWVPDEDGDSDLGSAAFYLLRMVNVNLGANFTSGDLPPGAVILASSVDESISGAKEIRAVGDKISLRSFGGSVLFETTDDTIKETGFGPGCVIWTTTDPTHTGNAVFFVRNLCLRNFDEDGVAIN